MLAMDVSQSSELRDYPKMADLTYFQDKSDLSLLSLVAKDNIKKEFLNTLYLLCVSIQAEMSDG